MALKTIIKNISLKLYIRFKGNQYYLNKAIKEADRLYKENGRRYRVFFFGYKFRVWTRQDIKNRKNNGLFKSDLKAGEDFDRICFYDTQNPDGYVLD